MGHTSVRHLIFSGDVVLDENWYPMQGTGPWLITVVRIGHDAPTLCSSPGLARHPEPRLSPVHLD